MSNKIRYNSNYMGPINKQWIEDNGDDRSEEHTSELQSH